MNMCVSDVSALFVNVIEHMVLVSLFRQALPRSV